MHICKLILIESIEYNESYVYLDVPGKGVYMKFLDVAPVGPFDEFGGGLLGPTIFVAIIALIVIAIIVAVLLIVRKKRKKAQAANTAGVTQTAGTAADNVNNAVATGAGDAQKKE